jgi:hypothetical protein
MQIDVATCLNLHIVTGIEDKDSGESTRLHEGDASDRRDSHPHGGDIVSTLQQAVSRFP